MKWKREARGLYVSDDERFHVTLIPSHWELVREDDRETGREGYVEDCVTLGEAKYYAETHP